MIANLEYERAFYDEGFVNLKNASLNGQKLKKDRFFYENCRGVYLTKDYVLKLDSFREAAQYHNKQCEREAANYRALPRRLKKFVPKMLDDGYLHLYVESKKGILGQWHWVAFTVFERVRGRHCVMVPASLGDSFEDWGITDLHSYNVLKTPKGFVVVDLGV